MSITPDEDASLRRLHWFERFGARLSPELAQLKQAIWTRDKRTSIREPAAGDQAVVSQQQ